MKTLITGGAGFIGSYLAHALLEAEHDVFVLDDLSTRSIDNIEPLKTHPRFGYAIDACPATGDPRQGHRAPPRAADGMRAAGRRRTRGLQGRYPSRIQIPVIS